MVALQVHVYGDTIFKYLPQFVQTNLGCVEFNSYIKRGASILQTIRDLSYDICSSNCLEGKPHAVVIHVGTNNLATYVFGEAVKQHWERIADEYVQLAKKFIMSGILPRIDW